MFGFLFRATSVLVFGLLFGMFGIFGQLIPALFWVAAWGTRALFEAIFRAVRIWPDRGIVIVLSSVLWAGAAMLLLPVLLIILPLEVSLIVLGCVGGVWGLCTGYQATAMWQIADLRTPNADVEQMFNMPRNFYRRQRMRQHDEPIRPEDILRDGIILGESPVEGEE